jgi:plasmid maintenance system antidote protein VapI
VHRAFRLDHHGRRRSPWRDAEDLSELVNEKCGISPEIAVRLSKVFGGTAEGWLVQQAQYDLAHVRADRMKLKRLELA